MLKIINGKKSPAISKEKIAFIFELIVALIFTGAVCCAAFSNLLFAGSETFPYTSDAMGHMAKVRFLAESIDSGIIPSWFPYWYNGTSITQYYPPLSYWIMAPIYMIFDNPMVTFKIYNFAMIFIGGMGVWLFCRLYIGKWCGIFGSLFYCIQPYILRALLSAGTVAQGPIIAIFPFYLLFMINLIRKGKREDFVACTLLCALMILSHPNTTFMMCLCTFIILSIYIFLKKINFNNYSLYLFSIVFAGMLTSFWSLIGATGLENQGIPYLLREAVLIYTATISWYTTLLSGFFYFAIPVSIMITLALIVFLYNSSLKKTNEEESMSISFCLFLTFFTIVFSFGLRIPLFEYLPLAESFVPGRILAVTSATGAILSAYLLFSLIKLTKNKNALKKMFSYLLCTAIVISAYYFMNPLVMQYEVKNDYASKETFGFDNNGEDYFNQGRYGYVAPVDCSETYFPIYEGFNITDGWNIEGTPHNQSIWNILIAASTDNYNYIAKELGFWNVRYLLVDNKLKNVIQSLKNNYNFVLYNSREFSEFYKSEYPSSYFLTHSRNAIIFGEGSDGPAIEFPFLVYDQRSNMLDYSDEELKKYDVVYLCEPSVKNDKEKTKIEKKIDNLVKNGVKVIIEPAYPSINTLFDVVISEEKMEGNPTLKKRDGCKLDLKTDLVKIDKSITYSRVLYGLDDVYYGLEQNGGSINGDVIGTKKIKNGDVLFIGMHMSQFLKATYAKNWGVKEDAVYPSCSDELRKLYEEIFDTYGINKNFWPENFPVENDKWNHKGVDFNYNADKDENIIVSVTYSPRWKALVDGREIEVGQVENLISLDLPKGAHEVALTYGITKYGILGYVISLIGIILFVTILKFYDIIDFKYKIFCLKIKDFLQL